MKIKRILFGSAVAATLLAKSAFALVPVEDLPKGGAYYAGWGQNGNLASQFVSSAQDTAFPTPGNRLDAIYISFLRWDGLGAIKDDGQLLYTPDWKSPAYAELRKIAEAVESGSINADKTKFIVSLGGYTYAGMWDSILDDATREIIAKNLVALMGNKIGPFWNGYRDIQGVDVGGIDLDFERTVRISPELNDALVKLVQRVRELQQDTQFLSSIGVNPDSVRDDLITLTTYSTGVDPVECSVDATKGPADGCSYVGGGRSIHSGEVTRLLKSIHGKNLFDMYNVMTYDAGKNDSFYPDVSIDNYLKYVPANRLNGGISVKEQWGPNGKFTKTIDENAELINLFKSKNIHGFFQWSIGGTPATPDQDIRDYYTFAKIWEGVTSNSAHYTPDTFTPSGQDIPVGTKSVAGVDHTVVERDGEKYVVSGNTWFEVPNAGDLEPAAPSVTRITYTDDWPGFPTGDSSKRVTASCPNGAVNYDAGALIGDKDYLRLTSWNSRWCASIDVPDPSEKMRGKIIDIWRGSTWRTTVNGLTIPRRVHFRYIYK